MTASAPLKTDVDPAAPKRRPRRALRIFWLCLAAFLVAFIAVCGGIVYSIYHNTYPETENSFFTSSFVRNQSVLVLVPHEDDEVNLAYGVIDAYVQAGSEVTVAFETNGDVGANPNRRVQESVEADGLLGVDAGNLVFLGYGDHIVDPPLCLGDPNAVRTNDKGRSSTFGADGYTDYHTLCYGEAADYTLANVEADVRQLILEVRPDVIFVTDSDEHLDHVSLSMIFDAVMGKLLREDDGYRPVVFKGFAYDYGWYGNDDFYHVPLLSAKQAVQSTGYNSCYAWSERVRFLLPAEFLSYTLRGSKLYPVLDCFSSQGGLSRESSMLNADQIFWERRTDDLAFTADVTASSGDVGLLDDFILQGYADDPLNGCWFPDDTDENPVVNFSWDDPQDVGQLVFYDAPSPAGDVNAVLVSVNGGEPVLYSLPETTGMPCRMELHCRQVTNLKIVLDATSNGRAGLFEVEVLPERDETAQWIKLTDSDDNFCYELSCPANKPLSLSLYGYPQTPAEATAEVWRGNRLIASPVYDGSVFEIPALRAGRYRIRVTSGACEDEAILRVGDPMLWQQTLQRQEQNLSDLLP